MSLHDLLDLGLVLGLHGLHDRILVTLRLLLVVIASLLELLECHLKLALRLEQVSLVVILLRLEEHNLTLPQGLIAIIVALKILELSLRLLQLGLHFRQVLSLH